MGKSGKFSAPSCYSIAAFGIGCLALLSPSHVKGQTESFSFALLGDLGYIPSEEPWTENVFAEVAKHPDLSFVVHVGDLSSPRLGCTDKLQEQRLAQFNALPQPVIYTPGDNEWTDCHPGQNVQGYEPLERLSTLRTRFYSSENSLGLKNLPLLRQSKDETFSKFRENARWDQGGVTFVTLHVTGSNNGLGRTAEGDEEFKERNSANSTWLKKAFAHASSTGSRAVMVIQQANMWPEMPPFPGKPQTPSGTSELRGMLEQEATAFRKPVVLVQGDSHYFRIDNPFRKDGVEGQRPVPSLENFMRVETFGTPNHHWLHVTVDPSDPNVFLFRPRIVEANRIKRK